MNVTWAKYTALLFLLPGVPLIVNAQTEIGSATACTNASIAGTYGYTLSGWIFTSSAEEPFADSGSLTSNGSGALTGSSTFSLDGETQARTLTATYSVSSNCTGTATLSDNLGNTMDLNLVLVDNGQSIQLVQSDSDTSISGMATAAPATCTLETVSGPYSFALNGWIFDTSGNPYPFTDTGELTSSGTGTLTLNDTVSAAGSVSTRSISGTYQVNSHCVGTATLNPGTAAIHLNFTVVTGGLVFIQTDAGTTISGSANTLGNVIAGGTMAHIAAGGGWQTTFTLINSGTSSSQVELNFFDQNGNALSLPLTFVQSGAQTTASSVSQTIGAGATLTILSQGSSAATVTEGSAQLTSSDSANVSGFAIFRYNPTAQEAVVALETRNPAAFVLGFDNTGGLDTGVALSNVSGTAAKVVMTIRDETGAVLDTTSISLSARGHTAFELPKSYTSSQNKRGTVEFDTPAGGQITVLGILATPTGAFTSIPAVVK